MKAVVQLLVIVFEISQLNILCRIRRTMKGIIDNNVFIRNNNQGSRKLSILSNSL
jgi:hypothetical protein